MGVVYICQKMPPERKEEKSLRIKGFLSLIMILSVLFAFCACGGEAPVATDPVITTAAPTTEATEPAPTEDGKIDYLVKVTDATGAPMASVMVQICHSNGCFAPAMTNAEGVATFHLAEGQDYKATFTAVPEGYTAETAEIYFEGATELTLVLTAA